MTAPISCQYSSQLYHLPDKPGVSLSLGRNIEMNKIKEGEDIYLECLVTSRPPPSKLYFKHQVSQSVRISDLFITERLGTIIETNCLQRSYKKLVSRFSLPKEIKENLMTIYLSSVIPRYKPLFRPSMYLHM